MLYWYDEAGHLLGEYDGTGALIEETVWLGDIPVATLRPNGTGASIYYIHSDQLNTPRQITRPSDNAQMWTWFSDPFGTDAANANPAGAGAFAYNLRFPGQVFDGQAGLHQNGFRDYDPAIGRYPTSDPTGLRGGVNTYAYVNDTPLMEEDTDGLEAVSYLLHHPPGLPSELPTPDVRPEVKSYLCKFIKECNGNKKCAFGKIYAIRHQQVGNTYPNWNIPVIREAENFSLDAAFTAWETLGETSYLGTYIWQFHKVVRGIPGVHTSPYSDWALTSGLAGKSHEDDSPSDMLKWCDNCGK